MIFSDDQRRRYEAAAHAMQSGVAADQSSGGRESHKHLRVGINSAMVETSAIGQLLMAKGIVSADEYAEAIVAGMEAEVLRYQQLLSDRYGKAVTLG